MSHNNSIDHEEIAKFSRISDKWWDKDGEFKILHQINPLRIEYITNKIHNHFNQKDQKLNINNLQIIDIGCGGGLVTCEMARAGYNITAIDASLSNIEQAKIYAETQALNVNYLHGEAKDFAGKKYDIILCLEILEHLANVENFFTDVRNLLKPEGMIIISTINRTSKAYLFAILMAEFILKWVPRKTHDYHKFLKPSEIQNFIIPHGLAIKELKGLVFDPLINKWHLSENIDVNYFAYITT